VGVLEEGRRQRQPTLAITNTPDSPLGQAADFVIDIQAGPEKAVAATKTYTAELMAIAMLSVAMEDLGGRQAALAAVPGWVGQALALDERLAQIAQRYRFMEQCVVLGRGYNYSTAYEWSLKLKELTYVLAEPYSSADFQHGPVALVERGYPVLAIAPGGGVYPSMLELLRRLSQEQMADLMVISDQQSALELARSPLPLPTGIPEWLSPIVSIVPGQLFAYFLTLEKGFDTEAPRSIHKVTETR
jgi:glucosamine--fructose-6-phosphate aminotransferase (isomerizing)